MFQILCFALMANVYVTQFINESEWYSGLSTKVNGNLTYSISDTCYYFHILCPDGYL